MNNPHLIDETIALHLGVMRFVDCFAVNKNNGGINVRFFFSKAQFSIATLYENYFWMLPPELKFIEEKARKIGETLEPERQATTEYAPAKKKGLLIDMPLAYILRYQFDPGEDQEKWRVHGFYKIFKATSNKKEEEVSFRDLDHAIDWSIEQGAYKDKKEANIAFSGLYQRTNLKNEQLREAWIKQVKDVVNHKSKNGKVPA